MCFLVDTCFRFGYLAFNLRRTAERLKEKSK